MEAGLDEFVFSNHNFFCVGVMYSGEYDACDVTLVFQRS
jgi:hypothetical protein